MKIPTAEQIISAQGKFFNPEQTYSPFHLVIFSSKLFLCDDTIGKLSDCVPVFIWWLKPIKTFDAEYCAQLLSMGYGKGSERLYRPAPSVYNGTRGDPQKISSSPWYLTVHFLPLYITPFYEHSVKLQTIHSHTWASSSISTHCSKDKRKGFATIMKSFSYKYFLPCPGNTSPQYVQRNGSGIVGHLPSSSIRYFVESSQSSSASVQCCNFYAEVFLLSFNLNIKLQ